MPTSSPTPVLPGEPAWDITFTRLTRLVLPGLEACMQRLAGRFQAMGLGCDTRVAQTPRGVSVFLALLGPRGLIGIVDMTLVDGQALGQAASPTAALVPWAALDLRLLDACGDVVAPDLARHAPARVFHDASGAANAITPAHLAPMLTAVYLTALALFDLPCAEPRLA
ncbi:MAG: hypothetical protein JZU58_03385 [Curvibacter lanceolatus]|jgi:hypothetical protein|uniref:hypothetical protein n=1 Tax=Curvibacter lanceolatus TaxID=86182 RepID=UPI0023535B7A|nr:hypothetical protein [Curvibacter lanceolatus]MBV5291368.1 hypothetical protein [Curvibacter lanceolatus]